MPNRQPARRKSSNEISPQKSFVSHLTHQSTSPVKPHQRQSEAQVAEIGQEYPDVQEERSDLTIKNIFWLPESSTSTQQSLPIDHKTIGVGTDEPNPAATVINYTDQAIQADFSSRPTSAVLRVDDTAVSPPTSSIGHSDKAIETDLTMAIGRDETPTSTSPVNEQPCVRPVLRSHSDFNASQASLISSNTSVYEQLQRLNHRFRRLAKQRRLITLLLGLYVGIMCGLLLVILMLLWNYLHACLGYSPIIYHPTTETETVEGGIVAKYGETCSHTSDCQRPLMCEKQRSRSTSSRCQCPAKYDRISDRCVGDLNAVCCKDTDCQQYMLCSGMPDGKRRCHCQSMFHYDLDRRQCRGEYHASCQSHLDCLNNLLCNRTSSISWCSCESHYRYDPFAQKCRGDAGARCDQATAECAENAECRDGVCECAFQFIPDQNQTCVDPCPGLAASPAKIRYPGDCRRFIDCRRRLKSECPEKTIFNFRTQLCDYRRNVLDCS